MTAYEAEVVAGGGSPATAEVTLADDGLRIAAGEPLTLPYVDIDELLDDDYTLRLTMADGSAVALSKMGRAYGQVLADLRAARDAALERALLLRGVGLTDTFPAMLDDVAVQIRLYQDLLVVVPERGTMFGVPYSFVDVVGFDPDAYQVVVWLDDGTTLRFAKLAKRTQEFHDELRRLLDALAQRTEATLRALAPDAPAAALAKAASLLRDGRAAQRRAIDPALWPLLEQAVAGADELRASYEHLAARAPDGWTAFGLKAVTTVAEGETPDASATDRWFFCPLTRDGAPLNAVAQEVTSQHGHATYVFRLMDDARFASLSGDALADEVARAIARLNRALLLLNFRREPIMLPDEQMTGEDAKYRVAMRKLGYLREARALFVGRAIHNATWAEQLDALLATI